MDWLIKLIGGYTEEEYMKLDEERRMATHPHNSLDVFKYWGMGMQKQNKYHKARFADFKGESWRQLHTYIKRADYETELFARECLQLIGVEDDQVSVVPSEHAQLRVFQILRAFENRYGRTKYMKDSEQHRVSEHFLTPSECLDELKEPRITDDCDGVAFIMYHLIDSFLEVYYPDQQWRVRCNLTHFYGHRDELHMNVVWVNSDFNDWCTIESTLWEDRRWEILDKPLWHNPNYDSVASFDTKKEYRSLWK